MYLQRTVFMNNPSCPGRFSNWIFAEIAIVSFKSFVKRSAPHSCCAIHDTESKHITFYNHCRITLIPIVKRFIIILYHSSNHSEPPSLGGYQIIFPAICLKKGSTATQSSEPGNSNCRIFVPDVSKSDIVLRCFHI